METRRVLGSLRSFKLKKAGSPRRSDDRDLYDDSDGTPTRFLPTGRKRPLQNNAFTTFEMTEASSIGMNVDSVTIDPDKISQTLFRMIAKASPCTFRLPLVVSFHVFSLTL